MRNIISKIKEQKNRIKENISSSKRFKVEVPEFKVEDLLKKEGINIHVTDKNEKSHDINFRVQYEHGDMVDGWMRDPTQWNASFTYVATNGYTFSKSGHYVEPITGPVKTDDFHIQQLLSKMKEANEIKISKPNDGTDDREFVKAHGGLFNDIINKCIPAITERLDTLQHQAEKSPQQLKKEEQIKRNFINDAYRGF